MLLNVVLAAIIFLIIQEACVGMLAIVVEESLMVYAWIHLIHSLSCLLAKSQLVFPSAALFHTKVDQV